MSDIQRPVEIGERCLVGWFVTDYTENSYLVPGTTNSFQQPVAPTFQKQVGIVNSWEPLNVTLLEKVNDDIVEREVIPDNPKYYTFGKLTPEMEAEFLG